MPDRVMNVPKIVRKKVIMTSATFQTRSMLRRSCTITECRNAVAVNHGSSPAFSTGSQPQNPPQPSSSYAHNIPSVSPNERIQPLAFGGRLRQERRERVVVHDHQKDEEHLYRCDHRHDPGNELAVPL